MNDNLGEQVEEIKYNNETEVGGKNPKNTVDIQSNPLSDKRTAYLGEIGNKYLFIVILLAYNTGFGSVLKFPMLVNGHGGIIFLILYLFISIFVAMPIYLIEAGIGQFYSKTCVTVFNMTPVLRGLGWSCLLFSILTIIPHCNLLSWSFMYMMYSMFTDMPWRNCKDEYTSIKCVLNRINVSLTNNSWSYETSAQLFFDVYIQGSRNPTTGIEYTFQSALESINVIHLISFFILWVLIFGLSLIFGGLYSKVIYFNFFVFVLFLIILMLRAVCLPGSFFGMKEYFSPSIKKSISLGSISEAFIHCIYSTGVGTAAIISIASLNKFSLNLYWSSYVVIIGNYVFSFAAGIFQFSVLGYMARENHLNSVDELVKIVPFKFSSFFEGTKSLGDSRFMCLFYSFILLNIGLSTAAVLILCLLLSLIDYYPHIFNYSKNMKLFLNMCICIVMFIFCIFFSLRGSILYQDVFVMYLESFAVPLVIFMEIIIVHYFYGTRHFRNDMKMILGYYYNFIWVIDSNIVLPMAMFFLICYSFVISSDVAVTIYAKLVSYLLILLCLMPIFVLGFLEIRKYSKEYKFREMLSKLIQPPAIIGPHFKFNWTINKYYQKKMRNLQDNRRFLETVPETENVKDIIEHLNRKNQERIDEKRSSKPKLETLTQPFNFSM